MVKTKFKITANEVKASAREYEGTVEFEGASLDYHLLLHGRIDHIDRPEIFNAQEVVDKYRLEVKSNGKPLHLTSDERIIVLTCAYEGAVQHYNNPQRERAVDHIERQEYMRERISFDCSVGFEMTYNLASHDIDRLLKKISGTK